MTFDLNQNIIDQYRTAVVVIVRRRVCGTPNTHVGCFCLVSVVNIGKTLTAACLIKLCFVIFLTVRKTLINNLTQISNFFPFLAIVVYLLDLSIDYYKKVSDDIFFL